jgi:hypothetical protein
MARDQAPELAERDDRLSCKLASQSWINDLRGTHDRHGSPDAHIPQIFSKIISQSVFSQLNDAYT